MCWNGTAYLPKRVPVEELIYQTMFSGLSAQKLPIGLSLDNPTQILHSTHCNGHVTHQTEYDPLNKYFAHGTEVYPLTHFKNLS